MTSRHLAAALLAAAGLAVAGSTQAQPVTPRVVALSGAAAPGLPGLTFAYFSDLRIAPDGAILFAADLAGTGVTPESRASIWTTRDGGLSLFLRVGQPAPVAGQVWTAVPWWSLDAQGRVLLFGAVAPRLYTSTEVQPPLIMAIARENTPSFDLLALEGTPAPGFATATNFASLTPPQIAPDGEVLFTGNNGTGLWRITQAGIEPELIAGDTIAGSNNTVRFIDAPGAPAAPGQSALARVTFAPTGAPFPGTSTPAAMVWATDRSATPFFPPTLSSTGLDLPEVGVLPQPRPGDLNSLLWIRAPLPGGPADRDQFVASGIDVALGEGQPAPGYQGFTIRTMPRVWASTADRIAARVILSDGSEAIVRTPLPGIAERPARFREGQPAPGLPVGVVFDSFGDPAILRDGWIIVTAQLRGTGITRNNSAALYAISPLNDVTLITRTGSTIQVAPGDTRTIDAFVFNAEPGTAGRDGAQPQGAAGGPTVATMLTFRNAALTGPAQFSRAVVAWSVPCYSNCDGSTVGPATNAPDLFCFLQRYRAALASPPAEHALSYANCDGSTTAPILNAMDFTCFLERFQAGCP